MYPQFDGGSAGWQRPRMTCRWHVGLLISALLSACGGDDDGEDGNDDAADDSASGDETPASDDFAPGEDDDASASNSGGSTGGSAGDTGSADGASSSSGAGEGGGGCVEAGGSCTTMDYCSTWICVCNAGATEFMTVGTCESGVCSTDGTAVCDPICANSGGVAMATDAGCG